MLFSRLVMAGPAIVQFCAAICAVCQPGEKSHFSHPCGTAALLSGLLDNRPGIFVNNCLVGILKPCVDEKDTSKKRRNKVAQCRRKCRVATSKVRKSWIFQNNLSFQKFYVPEMQEQVFNGRSKIALTQIASRAADRCIIASERRGGII